MLDRDMNVYHFLHKLKVQLAYSARGIYSKLAGKREIITFSLVKDLLSSRLIKEEMVYSGKIDVGVIRTMDYKFYLEPIAEKIRLLLIHSSPYLSEEVYKQLCDNTKRLDRELSDVTFKVERYLLVLETIERQLSRDERTPQIDLDIIIPRLKAIRSQASFSFRPAGEIKTKQVFRQKLLSLKDASQMYGLGEVPRCEVILAGGDATRYFRLPRALTALKDGDMVSPDTLTELASRLSDQELVKSISIQNVLRLFQTPVFRSSIPNGGTLYSQIDKGISVLRLREALDCVFAKFSPENVPKALNYAYIVSLEGQDIYLSFFMSSLLRTYVDILAEGGQGQQLYYIVRNLKIRQALEEVIRTLNKEKLLDKEILQVRFMDSLSDSIAVSSEDHFLLLDVDCHMMTTSTGHGPAFLKTVETLFADLPAGAKTDVLFSVRTMDNGGTHLGYFTGLAQRGVLAENKLRDELVEALSRKDYKKVGRIIGLRGLHFHAEKALMNRLISYVDSRWDYHIQSTESLDVAMNEIRSLPITLAFVISDYESSGGG
ncbi:MAG: hypothetical protein AABZ14_02360, partial [Candidatus Margulisiibacteriota bacterium]